jgi:ankyrin repeat protein
MNHYLDIITGPDPIAKIQALLDSGYDINTKNKYDTTLLIMAGVFGNYNIVKMLISNGADLSICDAYDRTLLRYAIMHNWKSIFEIYLDKHPLMIKQFMNHRVYGMNFIDLSLVAHNTDFQADTFILETLIQYADLTAKIEDLTLLETGLNHINPKVRALFNDYNNLSFVKGSES